MLILAVRDPSADSVASPSLRRTSPSLRFVDRRLGETSQRRAKKSVCASEDRPCRSALIGPKVLDCYCQSPAMSAADHDVADVGSYGSDAQLLNSQLRSSIIVLNSMLGPSSLSGGVHVRQPGGHGCPDRQSGMKSVPNTARWTASWLNDQPWARQEVSQRGRFLGPPPRISNRRLGG